MDLRENFVYNSWQIVYNENNVYRMYEICDAPFSKSVYRYNQLIMALIW